MNKWLLVCCLVTSLVAGCSKKRIAECDQLLVTAEKIAKCDKLPADATKAAADGARSIKESLKTLDDAGGVGKAPQDLVSQLQDLCKKGNANFVDEYTKLAPECMK